MILVWYVQLVARSTAGERELIVPTERSNAIRNDLVSTNVSPLPHLS